MSAAETDRDEFSSLLAPGICTDAACVLSLPVCVVRQCRQAACMHVLSLGKHDERD